MITPNSSPTTERTNAIFQKKCPAAPTKQRKKEAGIWQQPFGKGAKSVLDNGEFSANDTDFFTDETIGQGDFSIVYSFTGSTNYHPDYSNEDLVLKVYKKEVFEEHSLVCEREFIQNTLNQYAVLEKDQLPVAKILNFDTVLVDGFVIQERIQPFKLEYLKNENLLNTLQRLFEYGHTKKFPLDLKPENLGIRNGQLVLIDLDENHEVTDKDAFACRLNNALKSFGPWAPLLDPRK
ncbi:MAG: hypothetical protein KGJ02_01530 [Verrucomicrobiota bacterium]|nr:hypothetical protein [Verrucomicrobiota bacterium]